MRKSLTRFLTISMLIYLISASAHADSCQIIKEQKSGPFTREQSNLNGISVEKKSLIILNRIFPELRVIEKAFKGELLTCTNCTDNYIKCQENTLELPQ